MIIIVAGKTIKGAVKITVPEESEDKPLSPP